MTPGGSPVTRLHVATGDPELATARFQQAFPGILLTADSEVARFGFEFRRVGDGRISVDRMLLSGSASGIGSIGGAVAAARAKAGRFALEYGRRVVDTSTAYLRPEGRSAVRMHDAELELIELDPAGFAEAARVLLEGSGRVALLPTAETATPMAPTLIPAWVRIADLVAATAFDAHAFASPLIRAGMFELVVSGLLATFPITVDTGSAGGSGAGPATIRRAIAFIDAHLADPIDTGAIAAAAGIPVRTLQTGFQHHLGLTPMEHVRVRRLAAAHEDLAEADPAGATTVAEIAHRWGFAHLARFAQRYRLEYGEKPSETLRR